MLIHKSDKANFILKSQFLIEFITKYTLFFPVWSNSCVHIYYASNSNIHWSSTRFVHCLWLNCKCSYWKVSLIIFTLSITRTSIEIIITNWWHMSQKTSWKQTIIIMILAIYSWYPHDWHWICYILFISSNYIHDVQMNDCVTCTWYLHPVMHNAYWYSISWRVKLNVIIVILDLYK